ncbi:YggT family protein [Nocardia sp. SYP-A9097]|uniref:YggT family protein n=1 Tax=Nocardia sp. SYP-A9097 TaxID=2663237 RepID=UPI00129A83DE|nr:YggT family protein [Nocardia sp. SYP-A9097]MRH90538.1 YggT family protein [Nocardia sp. SYP-A9097]
MGLIAGVIGWLLTAFVLLMLARMVLDWVAVAGNLPEWGLKARSFAHKWTEPVIAPVRRVLPPLRAGGLAIDLAFTIVFILALVLRSVAFGLA